MISYKRRTASSQVESLAVGSRVDELPETVFQNYISHTKLFSWQLIF